MRMTFRSATLPPVQGSQPLGEPQQAPRSQPATSPPASLLGAREASLLLSTVASLSRSGGTPGGPRRLRLHHSDLSALHVGHETRLINPRAGRARAYSRRARRKHRRAADTSASTLRVHTWARSTTLRRTARHVTVRPNHRTPGKRSTRLTSQLGGLSRSRQSSRTRLLA